MGSGVARFCVCGVATRLARLATGVRMPDGEHATGADGKRRGLLSSIALMMWHCAAASRHVIALGVSS